MCQSFGYTADFLSWGREKGGRNGWVGEGGGRGTGCRDRLVFLLGVWLLGEGELLITPLHATLSECIRVSRVFLS
jgi:hypothetical protein